MTELTRASAAQLAQMMATRQVSCEEVVSAHLNRISAVDDTLHAFLCVDSIRALEQARSIDAKRAAGIELGPLAGVPVAVKDLFAFQGVPLTCGSKILQDWYPPYNATVVQRMLDADLVILGKTNLDEFGMGSSTENSAFGVSRNPWDHSRGPGGSGGGSAAALAGFESPLSIGSDTGGSIRQPAAVTGTVGVKPTYGTVSRYGAGGLASSLDQPGPCARNVYDAALLHQVIAGYDPLDSTSINSAVPDMTSAARSQDVRGMKIGIIKQYRGDGASGVVQRFEEAIDLLAQAGAEIVEVSCPHFEVGLQAYDLIMSAEASSNLARFDGMRYGLRAGDDGNHSSEQVMKISRGTGFGLEAKLRIILGTLALSSGYFDSYYGAAIKVRTLIIEDFSSAFERVDVLMSATTPTTAPKFSSDVDDLMTHDKADLFTVVANLAGNAAASFPTGLAQADGMPVGAQVIAPQMKDTRLYQVGSALEAALENKWGGPLLDRLEETL